MTRRGGHQTGSIFGIDCPDVAVHLVWTADWRRWLGAVPRHERNAARRKQRPVDRMAFLACRGFVRSLLGRCLGCAPAAVPIAIDANGRPAVVGAEIRFSLSHAWPLNLVAVAAGRRVGVDVEYLDGARAADAIAEGYFPPAERATILATPPTARQRALLRAWTRDEAVAKATGVGLTVPAERPMPGARGLSVRTLEIGGRWIATVAADGRDWRPVLPIHANSRWSRR